MPVFNDEKILNLPVQGDNIPTPALGSPEQMSLPNPPPLPSVGGFGLMNNDRSREGLSNDQLSKIAKTSSGDTGPNLIPLSEVVANKRYNVYTRGVDLENIYGLQQSWYDKLGNSVVKFGGLAAGTFLQSFATIPNTISAIKNANMAKLSGDPDGYEAKIDNWTKNLEDIFPNYYTRKERENPFMGIVPFMPGSANFWGDKIFKNIGFMAGAIGGSIAQDAIVGTVTGGIGAAPLAAAQIGKASLWINKIFAGTNKIDQALDLGKAVGAASKSVLSAQKLGQAAEGIRVLDGVRYGLATYGAARTEAAIEARDSYRVLKDELTKQYVRENGVEPSGEALTEIEKYATDGMNTRFGINMALLTVSNAIQFDNIFKSFTTSSSTLARRATTSVDDIGNVRLKEGSLDVIEKVVPETKFGKIWEAVRPSVKNAFAEGVYEEGGQFSAEKGVYDYYTRKYKNFSNPNTAKTWDSVNETMTSTVEGLNEQFGSTEGIESMLIGALTTILTGAGQKSISKKTGALTEDQKLQTAINVTNNYGLTGILSQQYENTAMSANIAREMEQAAKEKNIFKYNNLKTDMFFNFVTSRIPVGMHDVTIEQLKMLKELNKEEFEKTFGMDFNSSTKNTVNQYVDNLILQANNIKTINDSINSTFVNPFEFKINPESLEDKVNNVRHGDFNQWKTDLLRFAYETPAINGRIEDINQKLTEINPALSTGTLARVTSVDSLKELASEYEEAAVNLGKTVSEATPINIARDTRARMRALRTMSERINLALNQDKANDIKLFNDVLNFELNNQQPVVDKIVGIEKSAELFDYGVDVNNLNRRKRNAQEAFENLSTEKGFEQYMREAEELRKKREEDIQEPEVVSQENVSKFKNAEGVESPVEVDREYSIPGFKPASIKKISDDRYEVVAPDGSSSFHSSDIDAKSAAAEIDQQFKGLEKVKVLAVNNDGSLKIEDANGDVYDISPNKLEGYQRLKTEQEKLEKVKDDVEQQQKELELSDSGTIDSVPFTDDKYKGNPEDKRKFWSWLFWSTTSASEDKDADSKKPHAQRSIAFHNNFRKFANKANMRVMVVTSKQEDALGLTGLHKLSMGEDIKRDASGNVIIDNTDNAFVAAVYVEQQGSNYYFVDKDGKRIGKVGDQVDLNQVVFSTMPDTSLYWDEGGKGDERFRVAEKAQAEEMSQRWALKRKQLFEIASDKPEIYSFRVSNGIPIINDIKERNHVGGTLIEESKIKSQEGLIVVSTKGTLSHNGQSYKIVEGRSMIQNEDIFVPAVNHKFNRNQAESIYEVIRLLAADIQKQSNSGKKVKFNPIYTRYLSNLLYWKKAAGAKGGANQMFIDSKMNLILGDKKYDITKLEDSKKQIIDQLLDAYHTINNKSLTSTEEAGINKFHEKFVEFYVENGELKEREWTNYQTYLLSAKYPDGNARSANDTPVTTFVAKPTDLVPYNFKQKYAILSETEFPALPVKSTPAPKVETPKPEVVEEPPFVITAPSVKIGDTEFILDGKTVYTSTDVFKAPVQFTVSPSDKEILKVKVDLDKQSSNYLSQLTSNPDAMKIVDETLKIVQKDKYNPSASAEEKIVTFASFKILGLLKQKIEESAPKAETPSPTPSVSPSVTPSILTSIEDKRKEVKAAIKKAGQGEGGQFFVTLVDGTREGSVRISLVGNELGVGNKGVTVDLATIVKVENPDGTILYDAELAALEGAKPAEAPAPPVVETPPAPPTPKKKKGGKMHDDSGEYRLVETTASKKEKISQADIEIFKKWHNEVASGIPYEISEKIFMLNDGRRAYGMFVDGVVKFYKGAIRGTEYHEIFEGIWATFLTSDERAAILEEMKAKSGEFTDRETGKKIKWDEATDKQIKERIADDFAEYRLGKLPARSLSEKIVRFFKNIIQFVKNLVFKSTKVDRLFDDIEKGRFKSYVVPESAKSDIPEYSVVEGLTQTDTRLYVEDMTALIFQYMFGSNKSLYDIQKLTDKDLYSHVLQKYQDSEKIDDTDPDFLSTKQFGELFSRTKEFLRQFKIEFDDSLVVDVNNNESDNRSYAPEPFATDWKRHSGYPIKLLLGTLTKTKPSGNVDANNLPIPKSEASELNGFQLLNFSKAFATVMDKLHNTSSVKRVVEKLVNLASLNTDYYRLLGRLKLNKAIRIVDGSMDVDFSGFEEYDWRLFIQFYQTFTKQKPIALVQYSSGDNVYTSPANLFTAAEEVKSDWLSNMKLLAKERDSLISYNPDTKRYQVGDISKIPTSTPEQKVEFLKKLGINFPLSTYLRLSVKKEVGERSEQAKFDDAVSSIQKYISKDSDIASVSGDTLKIDSAIKKLAELYIRVENPPHETTRFNIEGERVNEFAENNYTSVFENEMNESPTIDEVYVKRPELNDVFSKSSIVLKKGGLFYDEDGNQIKKFKIKYIEGNKDIDEGKDVKISRLSRGDAAVLQFNQNLNGDYYILVPADSSTEWMINLGNNISYDDVVSGRAWSKIYTIFRNYLDDEVELAMSDRSYLDNTAPRAKELRFFKEILPKDMVDQIHSLIVKAEKEGTNEIRNQIDSYIKSKITDVNSSVRSFIESSNQDMVNDLIKFKRVYQNENDTFSFPNLDGDFAKAADIDKRELSEKEFDDIMMFRNINYVINNIEMHKVIFGDPYQFKIKNNQLDETKRIKSFLSPRRTTVDFPQLNTALNQDRNNAEDIPLEPTDPGYHLFSPNINTVTLSDVDVAGTIYSKFDTITTETDGFSFMMDNVYRELKIKNGQWIDEKAEPWHQWQMAYTRNKLAKKGQYTYTNEKLKAQDEEMISKPAPKHMIEVLKTIVSGNKANRTYFDNVLDKFSQMPLYYSMVEGTNLEDMYIKMYNEKIGYAVYSSGRKVGAESLYDVYNKNGELNKAPFDNIIQVPWKALGVQVETTYEDFHEDLTRGSQTTKISTIDLFNNGDAVNEKVAKEYKRYVNILNAYHKNGAEELFNKLGLEHLGDGEFNIVDPVALSESLKHELLRREASDNVKYVLELDENGQFRVPFESSNSYIQIRDIIFSMVDKAVNSPKMHGAAYVQSPVTMFEKLGSSRSLVIKKKGEDGKVTYTKITKEKYAELSSDEQKNVYLTDATLKMPTPDDPYMEVMLPHWFREKLPKKYKGYSDDELLRHLNNTEDGKELLKAFGFRIPTQALSSMAALRVKGFLPQYMGHTVIVPSEITTMAGSDFDIDKMFIYLKSFYIDDKNEIRIVKFYDSEETTKKFYEDVFNRRLEKSKINKAELMSVVDILTYELDDPDNLVEKYSEFLDDILSQYEDGSELTADLMEDLEKLGDESLQNELRERFVKRMYKRALENEYYDSLEKLITSPVNYERNIAPVDDAGFKKVAEELDGLTGDIGENVKNRLLNASYMSKLRHSFITAKRWVGIAAVNLTGHSNAQKSKLYLDTNRFSNLSKGDKEILGNGSIALPHNTVMIGNRAYTSMSGVLTADNKKSYISSRLSGYATTFVDVAKDPYIMKIIKSELAVGTFMFLERIGAGETVPFFMNQPIIRAYLEQLDESNFRSLFNRDQIAYIRSEFPTTEELINETQLDVSLKSLKDNIELYRENKTDDAYNAMQQKMLTEFLKYAKMAEYSFKLTQASNYDTTRFRSGNSLFKKQTRTDVASETNIFSSVNEVLDSTHLGQQAYFLDLAVQAVGEYLQLDKEDIRQNITDDILRPYAEDSYLSDDKYEAIGTKVATSLLDFIIQTKTGLNSEIAELTSDSSTSAVGLLMKAKEKFPNDDLIQLLEPRQARTGGPWTIKLKGNAKASGYDENYYIGKMRELRDNGDPETQELTTNLYKALVKLSILQGSQQSAMSIKNIVPAEDYEKQIGDSMRNLKYTPEMDVFKRGMFYRNQWKNDDIFKKVNLNYNYVDNNFPTIKPLGITGLSRSVLTLNEKYHTRYVSSDYLKMDRFIINPEYQSEDEMSVRDLLTGKTYSERQYRTMLAKGETVPKEILGFEKVKYPDGSPVLKYDKDGNKTYIYKRINLYGDAGYVSEYYKDFKKSVLNNGTSKVEKEANTDDLIRHFTSKEIIKPNEEPVTGTSQVTFTPEETTSTQQQAPTAPASNVEVPAYIVNRELKNSDGTKRFAQTDGNQIFLNPVKTSEEFFDYFEGKEGGITSQQKNKVLKNLANFGWSIERIKSTLNNVKLINTFIILHEQSHIDNNDKDVYWKNGRDLLTDDKVEIETRASLDALNKIASVETKQNFPEKIQPEGLPSIDNNNQNSCA